MTVMGALLYSWYPMKIRSNSWWVNQCPVNTWTPGASGLGSTLIIGDANAANGKTVVN